MPRHTILALALALFATAAVAQQQPCPPATPADKHPPCTQPAAPTPQPASSDPFAFPEAESRKAAATAPTAPGTLPDAPANPPADAPKPAPPPISSSSRDPDDPNPPTAADQPPQDPAPPLNDAGSTGQKSRHRVKKETDRIADDIEVAEYYRKRGNLKAAYLRYKDAVEHAPTEADAHLGLAQVAAQLGHREEAIDHYKTYLTLDPPEDNIKPAQKALADLQAKTP